MKPRGLAVNSALALAGDLAAKIGSLVLIIVAARLLPVGQFALLATGLAAANLLTAGLDLGAGMLLSRDGSRSAEERGALFRALLKARLPLAVAALAAAPVAGLALWRPAAALTVAALAVVSALSMSVLGLFRAAQDLRPEALQRFAVAGFSVAATVVTAVLTRRAEPVLAALACVCLLTVCPLALAARRQLRFPRTVSARTALLRAAPIGLLALATLAYYRSGTLVLAAVANPRETATFTIAASIAFGALALPNAITTALLPRLSAEQDGAELIACTRRALHWTLLLTFPLAGFLAAFAPVALPLVLGRSNTGAPLPFALLCLGLPVIATSGVLGTALLALGRLRVLGLQVACSLLVNLGALALLAPRYGAVGAACSTLACEAVGLTLLLHAAQKATRAARPGEAGLGQVEPAPIRS
jgi:O-antigen/teichoic acid export membrane protein